MKHFGYQIAEDVFCEVCGCPCQDIHHIEGRGIGKDEISNLIALCRSCHTMVHYNQISKDEIIKSHSKKLNNERKIINSQN